MGALNTGQTRGIKTCLGNKKTAASLYVGGSWSSCDGNIFLTCQRYAASVGGDLILLKMIFLCCMSQLLIEIHRVEMLTNGDPDKQTLSLNIA